MKNNRNISGRLLGNLRRSKGFTQDRLAARAKFYGSKLDREQIAKMETGIRGMSDKDLWHLSLALEVGVASFFEGLKPACRLRDLRAAFYIA